MSVESVTQSVSNLALAFGDDDAEAGAMVCVYFMTVDVFVRENTPHQCLVLVV